LNGQGLEWIERERMIMDREIDKEIDPDIDRDRDRDRDIIGE
jgi:hypothetical protein